MYLPVKFLLFDLDGTIFDTEAIFLEAYGILVERYGKEMTLELKLKCLGKSKIALHKLLIRELGLKNKTVDQLAEEGAAIQNHLYNTRKVNFMPGIEKLVSHMAMHKIPMSIATASPKFHVDVVTKDHKIFLQNFDHIITGEHGRPKPFPDLYVLCAKRYLDDPDPKEFLVFEDSPTGMEAGLAAGMQVVMIPHPLVAEEKTRPATKVLKSLEDFIPEEFGLPGYDQQVDDECDEDDEDELQTILC